jgi:FkbM family methyltransferase
MHLTNNIDETYIRHIYNEVVTADSYDLRPGGPYDVIYDIGANVGMFTMFAGVRFPNVKIVAVEPDENNFNHLKQLTGFIPELVVTRAALGRGDIYEYTDVPPGNRVWRCNQLGYPDGWQESHKHFVKSSVPAMTVADLWKEHGGSKPFFKIDTEGAEHCLIGDEESEAVIHGSERTVIEMHYFAATSESKADMGSKPREWVGKFELTHNVRFVSEWECGAIVDMRKK